MAKNLVIQGRSERERAAAAKNRAYWENRLANLDRVVAAAKRYVGAGHGSRKYNFAPKGRDPRWVTLRVAYKQMLALQSDLRAAQRSNWVRIPSGANSNYPRVHGRGKAIVLRVYNDLQRIENARALKEKRSPKKLPHPFSSSRSKPARTSPPRIPTALANKYRAARLAEYKRLRAEGLSALETSRALVKWSAAWIARHTSGQKGPGLGKNMGGGGRPPVRMMPPDREPGKRGSAAPGVHYRPSGINPDMMPVETCNCVTEPCNCGSSTGGPLGPPDEAPTEVSEGVKLSVSLGLGLLVRLVIGG